MTRRRHTAALATLLLGLALILAAPQEAQALNPNHECTFCHNVHGGGFVPRGETEAETDAIVETLCFSCHDGTVSTLVVETHRNRSNSDFPPFRITCRQCHSTHSDEVNWLFAIGDPNHSDPVGTPGQNIKLVGALGGADNTAVIRTYELDPGGDGAVDVDPACEPPIGTLPPALDVDNACYVPGLRHVVYEQTGSNDTGFSIHSFADDNEDGLTSAEGAWDGPCEICHTRTGHHRNYEPSDGHNDGRTCVRCHDHDNGFIRGTLRSEP